MTTMTTAKIDSQTRILEESCLPVAVPRRLGVQSAMVPKTITRALTARIRPRTCQIAEITELGPVNAAADGKTRLRIDSARLFEKLASFDSSAKGLPTAEDHKDFHAQVMQAVEECKIYKGPPELDYFIRKAFSQPIKGKKNLLLKPNPDKEAILSKDDDPEFMNQWIIKQGSKLATRQVKPKHIKDDLLSLHSPVCRLL